MDKHMRRCRFMFILILILMFAIVLMVMELKLEVRNYHKEVIISELPLLTIQENKSKEFQDEFIAVDRVEDKELVVATTEPVKPIVKVDTPKVKEKVADKPINVAPTRSNTGNLRMVGTFQATAYCACTKCCGANAKGITRTGTKVTANRTIAVDPNVIPLGSKVHIEGFGDYVAEDVGGAIKGNIVDIYFATHQEALNFGRRKGLKVSIIE